MARHDQNHCRTCGKKLGAGNRSGYCHPCAMKESGRNRAQDNANFTRLLYACREAGPTATERLRELLEEEKQAMDRSFAATRAELSGASLTAKLSVNLTQQDIESAWRFEQYATNLPVIAVDAKDGVLKLAYHTQTGQELTVDDIKRHFESAIRRHHPDAQIEWLYTRPDLQKPNQ